MNELKQLKKEEVELLWYLNKIKKEKAEFKICPYYANQEIKELKQKLENIKKEIQKLC